MKFFRCTVCDQVYLKPIDHDNLMTCCDEKTIEVNPNGVPAEIENHNAVIRKIGNFVTITIPNHPMIDVHHLQFICLETNKGFQYKELFKNEEVKVDFILSKEEEIITVYVYCNVHSLYALNTQQESNETVD